MHPGALFNSSVVTTARSVSNGVTDLAHALPYATGHGFADLELEPGTEQFTPNPAALLASRLPALSPAL